MKMLKKLAALILAATMVLVLFTACGGDGGSTGTREPEKEKEMPCNPVTFCFVSQISFICSHIGTVYYL
mgnify:CR=1 FL=1